MKGVSTNTASYLTAMARTKPSAPTRYLHESGLLRGRCLDYGCGRGKDANTYGMDRYDPHFFPSKPEGKYDTVTCTYVLNILDHEDVPKVLDALRALLAPGGNAYLSVRRDLGTRIRIGRGALQHDVRLDLPVVKETGGYCIYLLTGAL